MTTFPDVRLALEATLVDKMGKMSPDEFEQVLHPIFQEDELTLVRFLAFFDLFRPFLTFFDL